MINNEYCGNKIFKNKYTLMQDFRKKLKYWYTMLKVELLLLLHLKNESDLKA